MMGKMMVGLVTIVVAVVASTREVPAQPLGGYCCDAYGNRRCILEYAMPVGNGCWCPGQGGGTVCF